MAPDFRVTSEAFPFPPKSRCHGKKPADAMWILSGKIIKKKSLRFIIYLSIRTKIFMHSRWQIRTKLIKLKEHKREIFKKINQTNF